MTCKEMIESQDYIEILIDQTAIEESSDGLGENTCYHKITDRIGVLYIEASKVPPIRITESDYAYFPKVYGLMEEESLQEEYFSYDPLSFIDAGILTAQNPPLNLTGKGVIVGFIDTGIDYRNPVFQTEDGITRIEAIWDQTIQDGNPPSGFEYGAEYTKTDIQMGSVPSVDSIGHGTSVASVAVGSKLDNGRTYLGAAPDARIVVVKLKEAKSIQRRQYGIDEDVPCYMESDILQAIQYLQRYAKEYVQPLAICIGVGTNIGDHGGNGLLSEYMNYIATLKSRAIIIGAGNEGNARHHYGSDYVNGETRKEMEYSVAKGELGFVMEVWGQAPYRYGISLTTPGGEIIEPIVGKSAKSQMYTFVFERTKVTIDYLLIEPSSGKTFIRILFKQPTQGIWKLVVQKESTLEGGRIDAWLPIRNFIKEDTYFLTPEPDVTIVEPANALGVITASSYQVDNTSLAITSSRGYTSNHGIKPDIVAPGVGIPTIRGKQSGSSMAAAITTGGVAQFLQWAVIEKGDLVVDSRKVKNYLIRGATREEGMEYPNRKWGFGRLNIAGIFQWLAGF